MKLQDLIEGIGVRKITGETQRAIEGVAYHTKQVRPGFLFAAIRGMEADGHTFINEAVERGAEAILLEEGQEIPGRTMIFVANSRQALARASSNFYGNPSSQMVLIGITGTNGKTTTTYLLESILRRVGSSPGVIGTINYRYGQKVIPAPNTTPESLDLQRILREMAGQGVSHVIMEVSSHALDLHRAFGCQFDVAVFTNLTAEHLDYHKTLEHYFASKKRLFSELLSQSGKRKRIAVTNRDDPRGEEIVAGIGLPIIRYGMSGENDLTVDRVISTFEGLSFRMKTAKGTFPVKSKLIGDFNLSNIMAAASAAMALEIPTDAIQEGIERLEGVSGRFERVENGRGIHVIVDYAHTHDALERVLVGLKGVLKNLPQKNGKMITVFGCGGDRDRMKRPLMARVSGTHSDLTVLTSDNPRREDPLAIMEEAEKGFASLSLKEWPEGEIAAWRSRKGYVKIADRREAIRTAIRLAQSSDTVLIAGKGHEDYQIIGRERFPFDDRVEAKRALEEK